MRVTRYAAAATAALTMLGAPSARAHDAKVSSVEFIGMPPPSTVEERADIYTKAQVKVTHRNGKSETFDLKYHSLASTTEVVGGNVVGGLFDSGGRPIDPLGSGQLASDAPDGNSLMEIPGMRAAEPRNAHGLALVTQFEYRELPPEWPPAGYPAATSRYLPAGYVYTSYWSKLPAAMGLSRIDQDKRTGALRLTGYENIDFSGVKGGWIHCASSLSPWNTHLGSEEYEPDAKVRELGAAAKAPFSDDTTDIEGFSTAYFGNKDAAKAYDYGLVPEVKVRRDGKTSVVKHRALGRIARELADVQPDGRTVYMGDDGAYTGLFLFVAEKWGDLSEGTLYAARWSQTSDANGGAATLSWIRLGHADDEELQALVDGGIRFTDMFDYSNTDPGDASYKKVRTYNGLEWLRLRPGMEKAAAFLETRRYAALLGATTEFAKMEGISHNAADQKAYVVISRIEGGMLPATKPAEDPQDDVRLARNDGGAIYELALEAGQKDTGGHRIPSRLVATSMTSVPELLGGWLGGTSDAEGNRCEQEKLCGPDNIKFSEEMRTLFIGEDTSRRNNNYVWAFNVDTRKLSRILSVPMYGEATGLQVLDDVNGFSYILSNFQHPGEQGQVGTFKGVKDATGAVVISELDVLEAIDAKWDKRKKAAIGYVGTADGALPGIK
jgi:secreted PhoX family phosphatase